MRHNGSLFSVPAPVRDVGLALTRVLLGAILIAHGWQKVHTNGIDATANMFDKMSVPAPHASAIFAGYVELIGGILMVLGLLTPIAALFIVVDLAGAWWFVHRTHGVFIENQGWELVVGLGLAAAIFGLIGPGRLSVDGLLTHRRRKNDDATTYTSGAHPLPESRTRVDA